MSERFAGGSTVEIPRGRIRAWEDVLVVGAPLALALLELAHPRAGDLLQLDTRVWLEVHYAQIVLFPLAALAIATLVRGYRGLDATVCRIAMFVFAVSYVAFDTAAGVVTGILVEAARASPTPEAWRAAIDAVWQHPIVGGAPHAGAPLLALIGAIALSVGAVAAAIAVKRAGSPWGPVLLLAVASFGISIFQTHAWPGGPLTFGGIGIAAAWLRWVRPRRREAAVSAEAQRNAGGTA